MVRAAPATYDLTTPKSSRRVSFPYPEATPFEQPVPDGWLKRVGWPEGWQLTGSTWHRRLDVSSRPEGVCHVTTLYDERTGLVWNSHAGSHLDQPHHWSASEALFPDDKYNGEALIVNLAQQLRAASEISAGMLERALQGVQTASLERLLVRTYEQAPQEWNPRFAHLSVSAASYLASLPSLTLFGTDAPSVDHPNASPIAQQAHGALFGSGIAILEGYAPDTLPTLSRMRGTLEIAREQIPGARDAQYARVKFTPSF